MFQPREIVYGFTTSQHYYGVPEDQVKHGAISKDGEYYSYVFEKDVVIGKNPETGADFSFPKRTTVTFDYGIRQGFISDFADAIQNAKVVCVLNKEEFGNLLYAMYKSPNMDQKYKPLLERSLNALYNEQGT